MLVLGITIEKELLLNKLLSSLVLNNFFHREKFSELNKKILKISDHSQNQPK